MLQKVTREVKILSFEGAAISKDEMKKFNKEAEITNSLIAEVYQNFIKYENTLLLKHWAEKLVNDRFADLNDIIEQKKQEK